MTLQMFLQRLRCHGLQREATNHIRQQIMRPTAILSVIVFPIFDRCAKILGTLLLWLHHSFEQSKIFLVHWKARIICRVSSIHWPWSEFLNTVSASSRHSDTKATCNCAVIQLTSVHAPVDLAVISAFPISTTWMLAQSDASSPLLDLLEAEGSLTGANKRPLY